MGKGSRRRRQLEDDREVVSRWEKVFGAAYKQKWQDEEEQDECLNSKSDQRETKTSTS